MQSPQAEQLLQQAKKWRVIYPAYMDSSCKISQGRRLPMKCCVELPTLKEISNVLVNFGLQHVVEGHKAYSKDVLKRGRIKVKIADDNGNLCNTTIKNKLGLMQKITSFIKQIPNRQVQRLEVKQFEMQEEEQEVKQTSGKKNKKKK